MKEENIFKIGTYLKSKKNGELYIITEIDSNDKYLLYNENFNKEFITTKQSIENYYDIIHNSEIIQLNKWEILFYSFLDLTEFGLIREKDKDGNIYYRVEDLQGANLGDIESEEFDNADWLLNRMTIYEQDYIIDDILKLLYDNNIEYEYDDWNDLLKYRDKLPDYETNFDYIDMICNHGKDIDINKVYEYYYSE